MKIEACSKFIRRVEVSKNRAIDDKGQWEASSGTRKMSRLVGGAWCRFWSVRRYVDAEEVLTRAEKEMMDVE